MLADLLKRNHGKVNGCWRTNYAAITGLRLLASTTNGTSGLAMWNGRKVYFYQNTNGDFVVEEG